MVFTGVAVGIVPEDLVVLAIAVVLRTADILVDREVILVVRAGLVVTCATRICPNLTITITADQLPMVLG